jgi:hypothetical protein
MSRARGDTWSLRSDIRAAKKWRANGRTAPRQELIRRTLDPAPAAIEDMTVDHGGLHIAMAEEFLHGTDIIAGRQQGGSRSNGATCAAQRVS